MKLLDLQDAANFLLPLNLEVGSWNKLKYVLDKSDLSFQEWLPDQHLDLYLISAHLAQWLGVGDWIFIQIDNSTCPIREEKFVFQKIVGDLGGQLDVYVNRSILIEHGDMERVEAKMAELMMVVYFSLMYCWHLDIVSDAARAGQRLRLNDGVIYFYGFEKEIESAKRIIADCSLGEPGIADWQLNIEN